jgi:hypothetical protein
MAKIPATTSKPIQQARAAWETAVEAVLQDINRIAKGGQSNPAVTGELMTAVEVARLRCEEVDPCDASLISTKLDLREARTR